MYSFHISPGDNDGTIVVFDNDTWMQITFEQRDKLLQFLNEEQHVGDRSVPGDSPRELNPQ